ncbi:erythromycin esterase family protein [Streptomyces sp. NPDC058735]|uniref:erythromycin esterase family protein n=1 Tax=Streptomyces sp. NPDC058735 TaxID=3346616 RepID=UPI0036C1C86F
MRPPPLRSSTASTSSTPGGPNAPRPSRRCGKAARLRSRGPAAPSGLPGPRCPRRGTRRRCTRRWSRPTPWSARRAPTRATHGATPPTGGTPGPAPARSGGTGPGRPNRAPPGPRGRPTATRDPGAVPPSPSSRRTRSSSSSRYLYRDEQMAASLTWWHRFKGDRILLAAHDGHGALVSDSPEYPRPQGAFLRDRFGGGYVSLRTGFGRGSFVAYGPDTTLGTFTAGPPGPGSNEHRLERVPFRDCLLDLRTVPEPARRWLSVPRPTREIGTVWPVPPAPTALRPSSDPLVHLHRVEAARLLPE